MLKTQKSLLSRRSSSRKRSSARKKISKYLKMKKEQLKSLVDYVKNQSSSIQNYDNIYNLLKNQKEKNVTLFRGNGDDKKDPESINIGKWFSTSSCWSTFGHQCHQLEPSVAPGTVIGK